MPNNVVVQTQPLISEVSPSVADADCSRGEKMKSNGKPDVVQLDGDDPGYALFHSQVRGLDKYASQRVLTSP